MKTLGIIGGLSWFSTTVYYKTINQLISSCLGDSHSAKIILFSVDFNDFRILQEKNDWSGIKIMFTEIALKLQDAGADCIVMATTTPHLVAEQVSSMLRIPLLHIAEETAKQIVKQNMSKVALLGTKFTMENSFFKDRLTNFGITTIIPENSERDFIHDSVFDELTKGIFENQTKQRYQAIIDKLKENGAQGVIFGCTEMTLLISQTESSLPIFDTTAIHAKAAVNFSLS